MYAALNSAFLSSRKSLIWGVMRIVHDQQAAEDLAQETYLRARKAIENGPIEHLEAFLHQTARNLAIDHLRRHAMTGAVVSYDIPESETANVATPAPSPEETLIQRERLALLYSALSRLPKRAQTVWILSRIEKWPYPKIAEHLGVSPNTVYNDLKMAIGHCHDALEKADRS
ncbi:RNA polymerase, sigma-24 subunit, ECF subfamily [Rhizobium sp. PDO1-076]|uniref:RNA polymerase sigma factor n=1 Tax=Rhizobium sp. PDO1-076 TaxID=1125979 RepID=UPI00024E38D9|nr:sigma-70 family RNA polymerase sigma factor [Rhizobium sp. PDO1-076]EHS53353.1 RNA polymerase, sigma-24 subunit, ECF subfamily [Rhizobium sp. PDO1-076]